MINTLNSTWKLTGNQCSSCTVTSHQNSWDNIMACAAAFGISCIFWMVFKTILT